MAPSATKAYRHGDLRNACVREGLAILVREGPAEVSLRAIARAVGVSPRAPYRHFADKAELLAAMAEEGFARFGRALEAGLAEAEGGSAKRRLRKLGAAYIDFALENPHLVQLMFGDAFPDRATRFPALHEAALATFAVLTGEISRALPRSPSTSADARASGPEGRAMAAVIAWALVHGLADLLRHGQLDHLAPSGVSVSRDRLERFAVRLLLRA